MNNPNNQLLASLINTNNLSEVISSIFKKMYRISC